MQCAREVPIFYDANLASVEARPRGFTLLARRFLRVLHQVKNPYIELVVSGTVDFTQARRLVDAVHAARAANQKLLLVRFTGCVVLSEASKTLEDAFKSWLEEGRKLATSIEESVNGRAVFIANMGTSGMRYAVPRSYARLARDDCDDAKVNAIWGGRIEPGFIRGEDLVRRGVADTLATPRLEITLEPTMWLLPPPSMR